MAESKDPVSVITCDLEGKIQTMSKGATEIFGYSEEELVGRERVSVFSPGLTVLEHVPKWLATAVATGAFEGQTAFRRKDGTMFAANFKITPKMKKGEHIGYCGVTHVMPGVDPATVHPRASFGTRAMRWL